VSTLGVIYPKGQRIFLLHGFIKKTFETPEEALKDPELKAEYDALEPEFKLALISCYPEWMATKQKTIHISGLEKELLVGYVKTSPLVLLRFKAESVLLASGGATPELIAMAMDRKPSTVETWLRDWRKRRLASIFTGHTDNNNAGQLTKEHREEIQQALQSPPSDFGLPKAFWDVPQLKIYIAAPFGVQSMADKSYRLILHFANLSFKYADTFDRKRDDVCIEQRMQAIGAALAPLLASDAWEVFACDEVRMDQEAVIRKAWLKRGEKTVVKVNRNKESQSDIGFLNQKHFQCELFEMDWQKSSEVLKAYKQFLEAHPDKKLCVVWDNAPFHKKQGNTRRATERWAA
jgi:transposase